jgi:hypothetical protein
MKMNAKQLISVGVLSVGALLSTASQAATCNGSVSAGICTLTGPNVTWQYDINAMIGSGALALFDAPTLIGDNIRFLPPSFRAESGGLFPLGPVTKSGNFIFTHVFKNAGGNLLGFSSSDVGDYAITQGQSVQASLYLQAADNNDIYGLANSVNSFLASVPTGGVATPWTLTTVVDTTTPPPGPPFHSIVPAPDFAVNVQDTLQASTNAAGQNAWIQKKINIDVLVPVPAAVWLFGSALGLLGLKRRATV